jgi:hypothetical protein
MVADNGRGRPPHTFAYMAPLSRSRPPSTNAVDDAHYKTLPGRPSQPPLGATRIGAERFNPRRRLSHDSASKEKVRHRYLANS